MVNKSKAIKEDSPLDPVGGKGKVVISSMKGRIRWALANHHFHRLMKVKRKGVSALHLISENLEGKIDFCEKGKVSSTPQANSQLQDLDDLTNALDGEDMNQTF